MKHKALWPLLSVNLLAITVAYAVETFSGELSGDLYYPNGVLLDRVDSTMEGEASVVIDGTGSLTIGNQAGGGFPRLSIVGGTTIQSKRTFSESEPTTTWSGQFTSPGSVRDPETSDIVFNGGNHAGNTIEVVGAYNWGISNEAFTFSPAARIVLPADEQDNQKLWVAYEGTTNWTIQDSDFCIVENELCYFEVENVDSVALIRELYGTCPIRSVQNGSIGTIPNCIITCDSGYILNEGADDCEESVFDESIFDEAGDSEELGDLSEEDFYIDENQIVLPAKEYNFPAGHFRYRASSERANRFLSEEGLTEEEAAMARHVNMGSLSRHPRTAEEQLKNTKDKTASTRSSNEEGFVSYLIQMRNRFGANAQENHYTALGESTEEGSVGEGDTGETLHASGPLLPSTGPGIFLSIAVVGFALMLFGARRS